MHRPWKRGLLALGLALGPAGCGFLTDSGPPNVVLIVVDDLGYADLGCYGGFDIATPHIDSLARDGVRFTSAYVSAAICAPSRAGLFTGRYQQRFGFENNTGPLDDSGAEVGLPPSEVTLGQALMERGYGTGFVGKWHLGVTEDYHPLRRGFDEFFGFLQGGHGYVGPDDTGPILRDRRCVDEDAYLTDAFTREAVGFIERQQDAPFFLCVSYNAVHLPLTAPEDILAEMPAELNEERRIYLAMLRVLDEGVGRILGELERRGLRDNTLVVLLSDNGGRIDADETSAINSPFRGGKGTLSEGGIRVPLLMHLPGAIGGGRVFGAPVSALDIFPTALARSGGLPTAGALDGVDLLPHLEESTESVPHQRLYWRRNGSFAIREGPWKLVQEEGQEKQLFHVANDPGELTDLISTQPQWAGWLEGNWWAWNQELSEPRWSRKAQSERSSTQEPLEPSPGAYLEGFEEYQASLIDSGE